MNLSETLGLDIADHLPNTPAAVSQLALEPLNSASRHVAQQWQKLGHGPDGVAYSTIDIETGKPVEIRLLSGLPNDEASRDALRARLRLISLAGNPSVRPVLETDLHAAPITIRLAAATDLNAEAYLQVCSSESRLRFAAQLVELVRDAHRVGLPHGSLGLKTIGVTNSGNLQVDFTGVRVGTDSSGEIPLKHASIDADLHSLLEVLRTVLAPFLDTSNCNKSEPELGGRRRALLKQMLAKGAKARDFIPDLKSWTDVLAPWIETRQDTWQWRDARQVGAPAQDEHDQTRYVEVVASEPRGDDGTAEVSVSGDLSPSKTPLAVATGQCLGRFRLDAEIGRGGMGVVYRGTDLADNKTVAIKVLRPSGGDIGQAVRRFRKEARLLAEVQNDFITRLYEVSEDAGVHYLAMEYVDGPDLKNWLCQQSPLEETLALGLMSDIARALVDAHKREIVHRDIKPENILLKRSSCASKENKQHANASKFQVKLSDFGIARHVRQSGSLEVTQAGSMLGTPKYMSPEQTKASDNIGPSSDVYSLGVILFEMLTGSPPFVADDAMKLAAMHCFDAPPSIRKHNPRVSESTANIVERALRKSPEERFPDAETMLREIERVRRGEPLSIEAHPHVPVGGLEGVWEKTFEWTLESAPHELWPYVSNTERLNRALGLPSVEYRTDSDSHRGLRTFGSFRLAGVPISWEEHPFEWVEGERMGVLREFETGPFEWFMSIVTLQSRSDGTSRLRHQVRIQPRSTLGRLLANIEAGWKGGRNLDRVYRRIDRFLQTSLAPNEGNDAYEPPPKLTRRQHARIDERGALLVHRGVDPAVADRLTDFLSEAAPQQLAQIRPIALADQLGVESELMLQGCLQAAIAGLLTLRWDILCPTCRAPAASHGALSAVRSHTRCEACDVDFQSNLGDSIELVFCAHPEVRDIDDAAYCIGGPEHAPHVVAQLRIDAGERLELDLNLSPGDYLIRGPRLTRSQMIRVQSVAAPGQCDLQLTRLGHSVHVPKLRSGRPSVTITNDLESLHVVRVERTIPRDDVVTATAASTIPLFRQLFPDQVLDGDNPIATDQMTLLATSVTNAEEIYARLEDTDAYRLIQRYQATIAQSVAGHGGVVAKTVGESMLAAFHHCEQAVAAALEIQAIGREAMDRDQFSFGVGLHRGRTLVATQNDRLDYFGSTARAVQALPVLAGSDLLLTEAVLSDQTVQELFEEQLAQAAVESIDLPGRPQQRIQRIRTVRR